MKVSVVIFVYNEEKYIKNCLQSFQKQIEPPDEILIVDNNCTDKTIEIAKQFDVRIIREKKQGMVFARNKGFDEARYEIIARCDADTIVYPDWIKRIKKTFQEEKVDAVTGPVIFYDLPFSRLLSKGQELAFFKSTKLILGSETLFGSNMALTKGIWNKVKNEICLDVELHEDVDLAIHIGKYGTIKYDPKLLASISGRRLEQANTYIDYPARWLKTLTHKH